MKVVPKAESLDAVQVTFTKDGKWPTWLQGAVAVYRSVGGEAITDPIASGNITLIEDGNYLVNRENRIDVLTEAEFDKEFRPVRPTRAKDA